MMHKFAALSALVPLVAGHGFVLTPPARQPGDAYKAACGDGAWNQQKADINGNVQGIFQVATSQLKADKCNLWLCKGFQFDDVNQADVQSYSPGQKIDFKVDIRAPHTGYANVSVVKTSSNSVVGTPLIEFSNYASNNGIPPNNTEFSVTLPDSLDGCSAAGDCVLQWFWDAPNIDQTYEACVDFKVGGGSSGGGSGSTPSAGASSAASAPAASAPATKPATGAATGAATAPASNAPATNAPAPSASATKAPNAPGSSATSPEATAPAGGSGDDEECPADEETYATEVPAATSAGAASPASSSGAGEDDECPADEETDAAELPAATSAPSSGAGDDEECPADETDADELPAATSAGSAAPTVAAAGGNGSSKPSTVYVTVEPKTETVTVTVGGGNGAAKTVTVTAQGAACT